MSIVRLGWSLASFAVSAAFVGLWWWASHSGAVSPVFLPSPVEAWSRLVTGLTQGGLGLQTLRTVERMVVGWLLASLIGVALGAAIGVSRRAHAYLVPTLEFIRPLPASAMVPVAIGLLGLTDGMVLAVIAFGALWPMLLSTIHGFASVEPRLIELARALGLSRLQVIRKIALPNAMPDIFIGLRLSLTTSLVLTIVGEMLASRPGLGQAIQVAGRTFQSADLFAGVILLGALGFASATLLARLERRTLRWRQSR